MGASFCTCPGAADSIESTSGQTANLVDNNDEVLGDTMSLSQDSRKRVSLLKPLGMFANLSADVLAKLSAKFVEKTYNPGDTIITQGEIGDEFFVIKSGDASIVYDDGKGAATAIATLGEGDYFGELGFLNQLVRTATVQATSDMRVLVLTKFDFQELDVDAGELSFIGGARRGVDVGVVRTSEDMCTASKAPTPKTAEDLEFLVKALNGNKALQSALERVGTDGVRDLASCFWRERVATDVELISQGDAVADFFYIVRTGQFEVQVQEKQASLKRDSVISAVAQHKKVATLAPGDSFGELALWYSAPRAATVKAILPSEVWIVDRQNFKRVLSKEAEEAQKEYLQLIESLDVELLDSLTEDNKKMLAAALREMSFVKDQAILTQGEPGTTFYILVEGEVEIVKDGKVIKTVSSAKAKEHLAPTGKKVSRKPPHFGERALVTNEPRAATVKVISDKARVLALDKTVFDVLLGKKPSFMHYQKTREVIPEAKLKKIGLLGSGGFGSVELVEHADNKRQYAKKLISKGYVVRQKVQEGIMNEKRILMMCDSPFIVKLYCTYNSQENVAFLMEAILGGELFVTYGMRGFYGSEPHALYYVASVCEAFAHLHSMFVIYRDLKPENILFDVEGRVKLTDMGLAKYTLTKTFTTCGTPDYFAPEMILKSGHTVAVDWWGIGVLTYELLVGQAPFVAPSPTDTYRRILDGFGALKLPSKLSKKKSATEFIEKLLTPDPVERPPMLPGGLKNLEETEWLKNFDWAGLRQGTLKAPYVPAAQSIERRENFCRQENYAPALKYVDDGTGWDRDF
eukprot:TRINITY_DN21407_c0_g2_i1.p1 TRINITY_DN21407_c0_g2~~TRINITY_DN21407_c0_g2_i1.p1  ORF type:complete len:839 (+),score=157.58 TRINITY_DN21407_c0_g2_i1:107-2518(+)